MFGFCEARGMFEYTSRTVSYAKELTSVHICYSQGNGFYTPLSIFYILYTQSVLVLYVMFSVPWYVHVLPRTTLIEIMCVYYLHHG